MKEFAVINIGHPDIRPIEDLAEMIRIGVGADKDLVRIVALPERMTLLKHPRLDRMRSFLKVEPRVGLEEGVKRVCERIRRMALENRLPP